MIKLITMKKQLIFALSLTTVACTNHQSPSDNTSTSNHIAHIQSSTNVPTQSDSLSKDKKFAQIPQNAILMANGTEPGWILLLYSNKYELVINYGKDTIIEDISIAQPLQFPLHIRGQKASIQLEKKECIATSGEKQSISATVMVNGQTLNGCGKLY